MNCRHCDSDLELQFVDLGAAPPSNAYLSREALLAPERHFPLVIMTCENCWLVQTLDFARADELFSSDYAYFSAMSEGWLAHARRYVSEMIERFELTSESQVVEIASNDGYLLQYVREAGIPCLGVEPTASTARASRDKGIETMEAFFGANVGKQLIERGSAADLMAANNVLAHVPDINDFVQGFAAALKPNGAATFEFPHLLKLIEQDQFDTIYHEHFSYLSLTALSQIFPANGLAIFDVQELPTHGGSLRVFAQRTDTGERPISNAVSRILDAERRAGLDNKDVYSSFQRRAEAVKDGFVRFLLDAKREGKSVAAYGAAAKGNTLINFAGCRPDLIRYVVDRSPGKVGKFLPGSRIPIVEEAVLREDRPDYIAILPWNLTEEVMDQLAYAREWGARFVTAVPFIEVR